MLGFPVEEIQLLVSYPKLECCVLCSSRKASYNVVEYRPTKSVSEVLLPGNLKIFSVRVCDTCWIPWHRHLLM